MDWSTRSVVDLIEVRRMSAGTLSPTAGNRDMDKQTENILHISSCFFFHPFFISISYTAQGIRILERTDVTPRRMAIKLMTLLLGAIISANIYPLESREFLQKQELKTTNDSRPKCWRQTAKQTICFWTKSCKENTAAMKTDDFASIFSSKNCIKLYFGLHAFIYTSSPTRPTYAL